VPTPAAARRLSITMSYLRGCGAQQLVRHRQNWTVLTPLCVGSSRAAARVQNEVGDPSPV
jgi:hypothetical protein